MMNLKDGRKKLKKAELITSENELPLKRKLMLESNKSFREARDALKMYGVLQKNLMISPFTEL